MLTYSMRKLIIFLSILVIINISFLFISNRPKNVAKSINPIYPTPEFEVIQDKLWLLIQDWRTQNGFQPYIKNQELCRIAEDRASVKFDNHKGFKEKYLNNPYYLSENIAGLAPAKNVFDSWLKSSPHRAALEKPYKYSCVACDKQCVQIFSNF